MPSERHFAASASVVISPRRNFLKQAPWAFASVRYATATRWLSRTTASSRLLLATDVLPHPLRRAAQAAAAAEGMSERGCIVNLPWSSAGPVFRRSEGTASG